MSFVGVRYWHAYSHNSYLQKIRIRVLLIYDYRISILAHCHPSVNIRISYTGKRFIIALSAIRIYDWFMRKANISGERIRQARTSRGIHQSGLATAMEKDHNIKITQSDISEIESDVRGVRDYELKAIAQILGVDVDWLLEGEYGGSER